MTGSLDCSVKIPLRIINSLVKPLCITAYRRDRNYKHKEKHQNSRCLPAASGLLFMFRNQPLLLFFCQAVHHPERNLERKKQKHRSRSRIDSKERNAQHQKCCKKIQRPVDMNHHFKQKYHKRSRHNQKYRRPRYILFHRFRRTGECGEQNSQLRSQPGNSRHKKTSKKTPPQGTRTALFFSSCASDTKAAPKRRRHRTGNPFCRHLPLLHYLQKRGLRLGRRPVQLVSQQQIAEYASLLIDKPLLISPVNGKSGQIGGQDIRRKLNPAVFKLHSPGKGQRQRSLSHSRNILQEDMPNHALIV